MKIETERLIIREWKNSDMKSLIENINNINVTKYLLVVPYPYTKKDAKWWLNHCMKELKKKPRKSYQFAIALKRDNKLIGGMGFSDINDFSNTGEIGYWISEKCWGQGMTSEAIEAVLRLAFKKLKLRRVNWPVFIENKASNHLATKFGAVLEGKIRKACRAKSTGKIHDENFYGLLKEDWEKTKYARK